MPLDFEPIRDLILRAVDAQRVVDGVLSQEQQARELQTDGTYRVRCSTCGKSVSSPLPVPVIVRAWVACPECIKKEGGDVA